LRPSNDSCREPIDTERTERAKHAHLPVIYSFKGHPLEDGFFFLVPLGNIQHFIEFLLIRIISQAGTRLLAPWLRVPGGEQPSEAP